MIYKQLKKGTFRWRRKFRHVPTREIILKELTVDWLANRLDNVIWKYIHNTLPHTMELVRVREWEFVYIIHQEIMGVTIEIIQKEPFPYADLY